MISFWWAIAALFVGAVWGIFAISLTVMGKKADDWHSGYRAGQEDGMRGIWR